MNDNTLYKFQKQGGFYHKPYTQPYPSWGKMTLQIYSEDYSEIYIGWFDCDDNFVTEFLCSELTENVYYKSIDLLTQDAHYEKVLTAKFYTNSQSVVSPEPINILAISEPFIISEYYDNIHEIIYSNNEIFDYADFTSNFKFYSYFNLTEEQNVFEEQSNIYLKSNGETQRLSGSLNRKIPYKSEYQPFYRNQLLSKINILDSISIDSMNVVGGPVEIQNIDKYSLTSIGTTYTKKEYNFTNSNCL